MIFLLLIGLWKLPLLFSFLSSFGTESDISEEEVVMEREEEEFGKVPSRLHRKEEEEEEETATDWD